ESVRRYCGGRSPRAPSELQRLGRTAPDRLRLRGVHRASTGTVVPSGSESAEAIESIEVVLSERRLGHPLVGRGPKSLEHRLQRLGRVAEHVGPAQADVVLEERADLP